MGLGSRVAAGSGATRAGLAGSGACAAGTHPVWRFYNKLTINHRYTADVALRDQMRANPAVWIPEGYGADAVVMCALNP